MWSLNWNKGAYRLENLDAVRMEKIRQGERAQAEMRKLPESELCQWCHTYPKESVRGACAYCEDRFEF